MPAWVWIVAAAAVAFVAWFAWGRGWWRSVRYSWQRAAHVLEQTQTEVIPGAEYGSMILAEERAQIERMKACGYAFHDAPDWREQTRVDLSPEALGWQPECPCGKPIDHTEFCYGSGPYDPGAGGGDVVSSEPAPVPAPPPGDWLGQGVAPLDARPDANGQHQESLPGNDWLEAQMADLYAWVRSVHAMEVPA